MCQSYARAIKLAVTLERIQFSTHFPAKLPAHCVQVPLISFQNTPAGQPRVPRADCELVSLSPAARPDPDTDILQGSLPETAFASGPYIVRPWHWLRDESLVNMVISGLCVSAASYLMASDVRADAAWLDGSTGEAVFLFARVPATGYCRPTLRRSDESFYWRFSLSLSLSLCVAFLKFLVSIEWKVRLFNLLSSIILSAVIWESVDKSRKKTKNQIFFSSMHCYVCTDRSLFRINVKVLGTKEANNYAFSFSRCSLIIIGAPRYRRANRYNVYVNTRVPHALSR